MGATSTIGGTSFSAMSSSSGRKTVQCVALNQQYQKIRFHAPGANGNFLVRGGRVGGKILAILRYVETHANATSAYNTDKTAWENTAVTIVDETGTTYTRCELEHMAPIGRFKSIGRSSLGFMDVEAVFTVDS